MTNREIGKKLRGKFPQFKFRIRYGQVEAWVDLVCADDGCRTYYKDSLTPDEAAEVEAYLAELQKL